VGTANAVPIGMRVLITWGSKRGGTEGIGRTLGEALRSHGFEVVTTAVEEVHGRELATFDAVIVGGGLYANRWAASARRFVSRHRDQLRKVPVWFFSSGPLDDSADRGEIPATTQVVVLAERIGAIGHVTFGGRLAPDARGGAAGALAKTHSGDWRNPARIRAWADDLAGALATARPRPPVEHPARSLHRLLAHAAVGWGVCAVLMGALIALVSPGAALVLNAVVTPLVFAAIARHYFAARGARDPLPTAATWTAIVAALDLGIVVLAGQRSLALFANIPRIWLPLALIFLVTWGIGALMSTLPWPKPPSRETVGHRGRQATTSAPTTTM
jgi:menaquinone-dependent protoporphyrinogen oxidase